MGIDQLDFYHSNRMVGLSIGTRQGVSEHSSTNLVPALRCAEN